MVYLGMIHSDRPTHRLEAIKAVFSSTADLNVTGTALRDAFALGYGRQEIVDLIQSIKPGYFYKTMPSEKNPGLMQDVYRVPDGDLELYVKFTSDLVTEFKLLSFKER
jgi:motility quorum-sensing regulator/GCU-specific mRNA interferase toxin